MILTKEMEDGFLGYDTAIRNAEEHYEKEMYDDVFVHWEKKNIFGKIIRNSKKFSFKRFKTTKGLTATFAMTSACENFIKRLHSLLEERYGNDIIKKLVEEFSGNDDFSLGVQHALSVLKENKVI